MVSRWLESDCQATATKKSPGLSLCAMTGIPFCFLFCLCSQCRICQLSRLCHESDGGARTRLYTSLFLVCSPIRRLHGWLGTTSCLRFSLSYFLLYSVTSDILIFMQVYDILWFCSSHTPHGPPFSLPSPSVVAFPLQTVSLLPFCHLLICDFMAI